MTAVNWLDEQLQDKMYFVYGYTDGVRKVTIPLEDYMKFKQEALELEKQQIIDAVNIDKRQYDNAQHYFAETYGSKGSDELHEHNLEDKPTSSQTEISDEEIEKAFTDASERLSEYKEGLIDGAKWYREQVRLQTDKK